MKTRQIQTEMAAQGLDPKGNVVIGSVLQRAIDSKLLLLRKLHQLYHARAKANKRNLNRTVISLDHRLVKALKTQNVHIKRF